MGSTLKSLLYLRAVDPHQYDFPDVHWETETGLESPTRKFLFDVLQPYRHLWVGKDVLDVGCGTGWLLELLRKDGAKILDGFDPAASNIKIAHHLFPKLEVKRSDLEHFQTIRQYDYIVSSMVFMHLSNPDDAFKKLSVLLRPDGEIHIIVPDYDYFRKPRHDKRATYEQLNGDEYVGFVDRPQGLLADIIRKTTVYEHAAQTTKLALVEDVAQCPTEEMIRSLPRFKPFRDIPIARLLRFKHSVG